MSPTMNGENTVLDLHPIVKNQSKNDAVYSLSTKVTDVFLGADICT